MRILRKNEGIGLRTAVISFALVWLIGMASCHQDSRTQSAKIVDESSSEQVRIAQENEKKAQAAAEESQRIAEQAQSEAKTAQQKALEIQQLAENAQKETQDERQFSEFLKGCSVSLAVIALIVGTALGSKARRDSKVRRR